MAEPALKNATPVPPPKPQGQIIDITDRLAAAKAQETSLTQAAASDITNLNQYRQEKNKKRNFDRQIQSARRQKAEAAKTADSDPDQRQNLTANKNSAAPAAQKTEAEIAEQLKAGAPMEGISESAGLTGGVGGSVPGQVQSSPDQTAGAKKQPDQEKPAGQPPVGGQTAPGNQPQKTGAEEKKSAPGESASGGETPANETASGDETAETGGTRPKTRQQQLEEALKEQRAALAESEQKIAATKEKKEKLDQDKKFRRNLADRRLRALEKERLKREKSAAKAQKALTSHFKIKESLRQAWLNLIDTWGVSWFYIAFHFINAYLTPWSNLFCKFGEEWLPSTQPYTGWIPRYAHEGYEKMKGGKPLEILEIAGCVLIGLLLAAALTLIIAILGVAIYVLTHPLSVLKDVGLSVLKSIGDYIVGVLE